MNVPENLLYTADHEWVRVEGNEAFIGITDYAQQQLGDIVFIEIETEGEDLSKGDVYGTIEAVKTVSDMFMPISGTVLEVNPEIDSNPELVNTSPYDQGWMIKISIANLSELEGLLRPADYKDSIQ